MSILIKGMEMPKYGEKVIVPTSSGYVEDVFGQVIEGVEAVSVPTFHGRLIDADALHKLFIEKAEKYKCMGRSTMASVFFSAAALCVADAPTVIPADRESVK